MEKVAICSAKGGVGKTTISYCLAHIYKEKGYKVGLLDADIYGPNLINLFQHEGHGHNFNHQKFKDLTLPVSVNGIEFASTDLILKPNDAAILRGPILSKILHELYTKSFSSELDYLFIDMPPGTGDAYITIFKDLGIKKTLLVYVDDPLCMADVVRTVKLLQTLNIKIIGLIENLSEGQWDKNLIEGHFTDVTKYGPIPRISKNDLYNSVLKQTKFEEFLPDNI